MTSNVPSSPVNYMLLTGKPRPEPLNFSFVISSNLLDVSKLIWFLQSPTFPFLKKDELFMRNSRPELGPQLSVPFASTLLGFPKLHKAHNLLDERVQGTRSCGACKGGGSTSSPRGGGWRWDRRRTCGGLLESGVSRSSSSFCCVFAVARDSVIGKYFLLRCTPLCFVVVVMCAIYLTREAGKSNGAV